MLNHFHYLDNLQAARDNQRPLTFSRYAGPGNHRYPIGFSGDAVISWASLAFQPYFTSTAANIGYGWWSHDIGGHFFGARDDELATRWLQFGVFSPIMRLHSGNNPFITKEPWTFPGPAQEVMTSFLRLRHRLVPYLHTMNHRAFTEGLPLVLPMYYRFPEAAEAYQVPNQYQFGSQLVVAAITEPADPHTLLASVKAWLPEGTWVDVLTGLVYGGGREISLHRDLSTIPVLAAAGSVIPLDGAAVPGNDPVNPEHLELLVIVGADGGFDLIEDDGTVTSAVARTPIRYDQDSGTLLVGPVEGAVDAVPAVRSWTLTLVGLADPAAVVNGEPACFNGEKLAIEAVPTSATLRVDLGPGPRLRENDVAGRIFALLDRAQIAYETKTRVMQAVESGQPLPVRVSRLQSLNLAPALFSALGEILLA
jgi:hypothetical protein